MRAEKLLWGSRACCNGQVLPGYNCLGNFGPVALIQSVIQPIIRRDTAGDTVDHR